MSTRERRYDKRVTVYIPGSKMEPSYARALVDAAGGLSSAVVQGVWADKEGELHGETVFQIVVLYDTAVNHMVPQVLEDIRKDLLARGEKEVLMVYEAVTGIGYT